MNYSNYYKLYSGFILGLIILFSFGVLTLRIRFFVNENNKLSILNETNKEIKERELQFYSSSELGVIMKEKKIVFLDNYIVDVSDYIEYHPGGQIHLIENLNLDISRYFYGTTSINPGFNSHSHSISTYKYIMENLVKGVIKDESGLIINSKKESEEIDTELILVSSRPIAKNICEFKFSSKDQYSSISFMRFIHGYSWIGRHFAV